MAEKLISLEEVGEHNTTLSMWISIAGKVYDVTEFYKSHPGGEEILLDHAGTDATYMFEDIGHSADARELMKKYYIGRLIK